MTSSTLKKRTRRHQSPVSVQLVCNYVPCKALDPDERRLKSVGSFNDEFHPSQSQTFCPAQLDFDKEEPGARHLNINDEFHFSPSGTYCLVPSPK
eukprot:scaffold33090_cov38-Cyclotella_meneghiniana.AAC.4